MKGNPGGDPTPHAHHPAARHRCPVRPGHPRRPPPVGGRASVTVAQPERLPRRDPDACALSVHLSEPEAGALTDALQPPHHDPMLLHATELGLVVERIELSAASRWNGRQLGDTRLRTRTGSSVVAILRGPTHTVPAPVFRLAGGDILIVVGRARAPTRGRDPRPGMSGRARHAARRTRGDHPGPRPAGPPGRPLRAVPDPAVPAGRARLRPRRAAAAVGQRGVHPTGAEIGVVLLLLTLGLEYTAAELVTSLKTHYPAGAVDFVLNARPGRRRRCCSAGGRSPRSRWPGSPGSPRPASSPRSCPTSAGWATGRPR